MGPCPGGRGRDDQCGVIGRVFVQSFYNRASGRFEIEPPWPALVVVLGVVLVLVVLAWLT